MDKSPYNTIVKNMCSSHQKCVFTFKLLINLKEQEGVQGERLL